MSKGGVLFEADSALRSADFIELILEWPFLLNGVCPLKLVIHGRVARNEGNRIAIRIKHHEFHTTSAPSPTARLFSEKMPANQERFLSNSQLRHSQADPEDQRRHPSTLLQKTASATKVKAG
jgi:hypothetical protein